jgi:hypothetical protein
MASGEINLFLGDFTKMPETLKARHLSSDDFALAQRRAHPRGLAPPSMDEYCTLPHVVVSSRADFSTPLDQVLATLGRRRTVIAAVPRAVGRNALRRIWLNPVTQTSGNTA